MVRVPRGPRTEALRLLLLPAFLAHGGKQTEAVIAGGAVTYNEMRAYVRRQSLEMRGLVLLHGHLECPGS